MGLFMLAPGAYFLGTGWAGMLAKPPDPPTQAYWWFVAGFIWRSRRVVVLAHIQIATRNLSRIVFGALALTILSAALVIGPRFTQSKPHSLGLFHPRPILLLRSISAKVLVLEFTAAWCLNCHALEQAVLHDPRVVALLNSHNVIPIKVDLLGTIRAG